MKRVGSLLSSHNGQKAWLFGKGPSLDDFDSNRAGDLRICINESVTVVPEPTYFFAHDEQPIRRAANAWPKGCRAILQPVRATFAIEQGIPEDNVITYDKRQGDGHAARMPCDQIAKHSYLYGNSGTIHSAIHFCRLIGVEHVELVGVDGGGGYAQKLDIEPGGAQHERIRRDAINLLELLEIPYTFNETAC